MNKKPEAADEKPARPSPSYLQTVMKVVTGSAAAQAIPLLAMLLLTRLVSIESIGIYNIWLAAIWITLVPATARMEILLVSLPGAHERRLAFQIGCASAFGVGLLTAVVALLLSPRIQTALPGWTPSAAILLGLGTWAMAMQTLWLARAVSHGAFGIVNRIRITSAGLAALLQIILAFFWPNGFVLMLAYVIGTACASWAALSGLRHQPVTAPAPGEATTWRSLMRQHGKTPMLALPANLINTVAQQLPQMLTGVRFGEEAAGLLGTAWRAISAPMSVIGNSALDVYKNQASDEFNRTGQCRGAYLRTLRLLALVGLIPSAILLFWGPPLFALAFGEPFRAAGEIAQVFAPMLFIRFFASPLSYTLLITRKAHLDLYWQIGLLVLSIIAFTVPDQAMTAFTVFSAGYAALYVIYLMMQWQAAGGEGSRQAAPDANQSSTLPPP